MKKLNLLLLGLLCLCGGAAMAQYKVLLNFNKSNGLGSVYASLAISGKTLYGVSEFGGANDSGTIFSIDTNGGNYADLHDCNGKTAIYPVGNLTVSGGRLFGMGALGGAHDSGSIFVVNTDGSGFRDIYDFSGGVHGRQPQGELLLVGNKLYGTTLYGGGDYKGMVFSVDTDGTKFQDLLDFYGATYGSNPYCGLVLSGNTLYGVTPFGGGHDSGAIFAVNTDGSNPRTLYSFNKTSGWESAGALALSGSKLFGGTYEGGATGMGTVFSIDTDGTGYAVLHNFATGNGTYCYGPLSVSGTTLLGMCAFGGAHDSGCLFSIQTNGGGYTDIYDCDHNGWYGQINNLVIAGQTMFGIFPNGGLHSEGVVFSFKYSTLSVANISIGAAEINVYPNPNNGVFTMEVKSEELRGKSSNIAVYNMLGEKVYSESTTFNSQLSINLSNQPNGIYLYKVISEDGTMAGEGKLVIQK